MRLRSRQTLAGGVAPVEAEDQVTATPQGRHRIDEDPPRATVKVADDTDHPSRRQAMPWRSRVGDRRR